MLSTRARTFLDGVRTAWRLAMATPAWSRPMTSDRDLTEARRQLAEIESSTSPDDGRLNYGVSVVVATFRGRDHVLRCLESLARQDLDRDLFEVLVVANGEPDGTIDLVQAFRGRNPDLRLRIVESRRPGNSLARNLGAAAASCSFLCWVDDDDEVSPTYLSALLGAAGEGTVPVAHLVDVYPDGRTDTDNPISATLLAHEGRARLAPVDLYSPVVLDACKLLPTARVREIGYDTALTSGQDVLFNGTLAARWPFTFTVLPLASGAVYYRHVRDGSLSRKDPDFQFAVRDRLDVVQRLDRLIPGRQSEGGGDVLSRRLVRAQSAYLARYVARHPQELNQVLGEIGRRQIQDFPYDLLGVDSSTLVVSYCFAPFADTAAVVMAKRIRAAGDLCDVVSNDMSSVRSTDPAAGRIAGPLVRRHFQTGAPAAFADWNSIAAFCRQGSAQVGRRRYDRIYSRVMWPASNFLAALLKVRGTGTEWVAEFSDPVRHDVAGRMRTAPIDEGDELLTTLAAAVRAQGLEPPSDENLFSWTEVLAFALADRIVFTNDLQMQFMLEHTAPELATRVRERAVVQPHPTLGPDFYDATDPSYGLDRQFVNIAFFGTFYVTRGLGSVLDGLEAISAQHGDRIRLHVFCPAPDALRESIGSRPAAKMVVANHYVGYLDFLALTTRFDVLLVNDAEVRDVHGVNPYLPSKWSDYRGSGTRVWGIVEEGSVLSTMPLDHTSFVGDVPSTITALAGMVHLAQKEPAV